MSRNEIVAKIEVLNEWENIIEEAKAEAEALRDSIKAEMMERNVEDALILFDELTEEKKQAFLAYLRGVCKDEEEVV